MKLKLSKQEYNLLISECELFKKYLITKNETILFTKSNIVNVNIEEDLFLKILSWIEDNLDRYGFDIDYNLNKKGILLRKHFRQIS